VSRRRFMPWPGRTGGLSVYGTSKKETVRIEDVPQEIAIAEAYAVARLVLPHSFDLLHFCTGYSAYWMPRLGLVYLGLGSTNLSSGANCPARRSMRWALKARAALRTSSCNAVSLSSASWLVAYGPK
jgi:hypothetical protein